MVREPRVLGCRIQVVELHLLYSFNNVIPQKTAGGRVHHVVELHVVEQRAEAHLRVDFFAELKRCERTL